ncbi:MAG: IclR family transcriptional regulator C-terminal domain-containing protein [Variovorax sp.]
MSSAGQLIAILSLFTLQRPSWSAPEAGAALGFSRASAYRYFSLLTGAGLINDAAGHEYTLGPRIVELDRQIRLGDPLVQAAVDEMLALTRASGGTALLCRLYNQRVLCVHQERGQRPLGGVSYERGRAMPLYRGATSRVILAQLSVVELERLIHGHRAEMLRAGLPRTARALHALLAPVREARACVAYGEVDPNRCGVAVPICAGAEVIGSLSLVLPAAEAKGRLLKNAQQSVIAAGLRIEAELEAGEMRSAKRPHLSRGSAAVGKSAPKRLAAVTRRSAKSPVNATSGHADPRTAHKTTP